MTLAKHHEDLYNNHFERYVDEIYTTDVEVEWVTRGTKCGLDVLRAAEEMAIKACPDRRTTVVRVMCGEDCFVMEEIWEGTNTGGAELFGPPGAKVRIQALSIIEPRDGKIATSRAWVAAG